MIILTNFVANNDCNKRGTHIFVHLSAPGERVEDAGHDADAVTYLILQVLGGKHTMYSQTWVSGHHVQ